MTYHFVRLFASLINALPLSCRLGVGDLIGNIGWRLLPRRRRLMMITNIKLGLSAGAEEAVAIAKACTTRFGRMMVEVFFQGKFNRNSVNQRVTFRGREHLDAALAEGKGVILATAHTGNWEMLATVLALNGYPLAAIAQKQHNNHMDRFINEQRQAPGTEIVYRSEVRDIVRLLDRGKIIGLLMDQDAHHKGVFVPFLGRPASTPQGPAAIARLRGAPIVPAFISEVSPGQHEVIIHPVMRVEKTGDRDADIFDMTARLTQIIENHVRQHPTEWFWLHDRWKTQPKGTSLSDC